MDEKKKVKFSKSVAKILIPVLIVVAIGMIWYLKKL